MNSTSNPTADDEHAELQKVMKSTGLSALYEKFRDAGITVDIIWKLENEILDDMLKLNPIDKLKYNTAKKQATIEKLDN